MSLRRKYGTSYGDVRRWTERTGRCHTVLYQAVNTPVRQGPCRHALAESNVVISDPLQRLISAEDHATFSDKLARVLKDRPLWLRIIRLRWLSEPMMTLNQVAEELQLSKGYVWQCEEAAMKQIRERWMEEVYA